MRVILEEDAGSSGRTRSRAPASDTFGAMKTVAARVRALDPLWADALLAGLFAVESALELVLLVPAGTRDIGFAAVFLAAIAAALALRRRLPLAAILTGWAVFPAFNILLPGAYNDKMIGPYFAIVFLAYSAGRHLGDRRALVALVTGLVAVSASTALDHYDDTVANALTSLAFAPVAPMLIGRFLRHRAQLHATLRDKTARLAAQREERAAAVAEEERTRIAGELHDVVAHALSAMVVQGAAARRLTVSDPARAAAAFAAVEATGREALTEIRSLLGVLRREDEELALAPQPSLRHLSSLVARTRAAGLPVELAVQGEERPLTAGIDLTAYRVIQEALRSAIEQGHAGRAEILLRYGDDHVDLRVGDDGPVAPARDLPGVRERVNLYGGQLMTGMGRDGAHRVRARLPLGGPA